MEARPQIGNILVDAGIITSKTLERALTIQEQKGRRKRLGTLLREMGLVTEEEIVLALARQCNVRTIKKFAELTYARELLDLVPAHLALAKQVFPLKHYRRMLALATADPFDHPTFETLAQVTGMDIYPVLATREDIIAAIRKHYLGGGEVILHCARILVISDAMAVRGLTSALQRESFEVIGAADAMDGLSMAYGRLPDLIICDLVIPGMHGRDFMEALRAYAKTATIPVMVMVDRNRAGRENPLPDAAFADVIVRPFRPSEVIARVRTVLALSAKTGQPSLLAQNG